MDLTFVVPVKGRLKQLQQTLPLLVNAARVVVVDYDCPDETAAWVRSKHPEVRVAQVLAEPIFHLSKARNIGANFVNTEWIGFIDADMLVSDQLVPEMNKVAAQSHYFIFQKVITGYAGFLVCRTEDFRETEGYDEKAIGYGYEDTGMRLKLGALKLKEIKLGQHLATHLDHGNAERTKFYKEQNPGISWEGNRRVIEADLLEWARRKGLGLKPWA